MRELRPGRTETSGFDPAAYYTEDYFSGRHADGYSDYLGAEPVLRREFARSVEFIRGYRSAGKLLELGCAYGFFLLEAARYFDVTGIELAPEAAEHARRAGLHVLQGMADEASLRQIGHVDVIVLFDVIEHLPDPRETLALCHRQLNPGGIIVITTGDFGSMAAKLAGVRWRLLTPPQHLWFFTQESLRRMAGRSRPCVGACGPSLEDRSGLADRVSVAQDAGTARGRHGERQPARDTRQPVRRHAHRSAQSGVTNADVCSGEDSPSPPATRLLLSCMGDFPSSPNLEASDGTCLAGAGVCGHPGL